MPTSCLSRFIDYCILTAQFASPNFFSLLLCHVRWWSSEVRHDNEELLKANFLNWAFTSFLEVSVEEKSLNMYREYEWLTMIKRKSVWHDCNVTYAFVNNDFGRRCLEIAVLNSQQIQTKPPKKCTLQRLKNKCLCTRLSNLDWQETCLTQKHRCPHMLISWLQVVWIICFSPPILEPEVPQRIEFLLWTYHLLSCKNVLS